jgi:uncharacterized protein YjbI with pentapeptide repeats
MKRIIFATTTLLAFFNFYIPVRAENLQHVSQLLATKVCFECDLSQSGLVLANLNGANLSGANLVQANLSGANLSGANLSGANLSGASLNGANLTGANLTGANLTGTDLRNAYLMNANLTGISLQTAYVEGAIGLYTYEGTAQEFHNWAAAEANKGNYQGAIAYYSRALAVDPNFAPSYLARGIIRYRLNDFSGADSDTQIAAKLFQEQNNTSGYQASQAFLRNLEIVRNPQKKDEPSGVEQVLQGIGSLLFQLFL